MSAAREYPPRPPSHARTPRSPPTNGQGGQTDVPSPSEPAPTSSPTVPIAAGATAYPPRHYYGTNELSMYGSAAYPAPAESVGMSNQAPPPDAPLYSGWTENQRLYAQPSMGYYQTYAPRGGPSSPESWPRSAPAAPSSVHYLSDATYAHPAAPATMSTAYAPAADPRYSTAMSVQMPDYISGSYTYGPGPDTSSAYRYSHTSAYEPRSAAAQAIYPVGPATPAYAPGPSTMPPPPPRSSARPPSPPPASRSVAPGPERGVSRTHGRSKPSASYTPYSAASRSSRSAAVASSSARPGSSSQPPDSPEDEPQEVKKKRKRANAHQLKVLNEVFEENRFPPTAEREALARQLAMTPRSVQIWFQNRRQGLKEAARAAGQYPSGSSSRGSVETSSTSPMLPTYATPVAGGSYVRAMEPPSANAPRGAPGYVPSPPRIRSVSPVRPTSVPGYAAHAAPGVRTGHGTAPYALRSPSRRVQEPAAPPPSDPPASSRSTRRR